MCETSVRIVTVWADQVAVQTTELFQLYVYSYHLGVNI